MGEEFEYSDRDSDGINEQVVEDNAGLLQWSNSPDSKKFDKKMIKDLVLANFDNKQEGIVLNLLDFTRQLKVYGNKLKKAEKYFTARIFDYAVVSTAKGGLARRLMGTKRFENVMTPDREERATNIIPMKKRGRRYF